MRLGVVALLPASGRGPAYRMGIELPAARAAETR